MSETLDGGQGAVVSESAQASLREGAKWAKIFAIIGIVLSSLAGLASIVILFLSFLNGLIGIVVVAISIYLYSLLHKQGTAIASGEKMNLDSFTYNYMMFWKIYTILLIVSFVLSLILGFYIQSTFSSALGDFESQMNNFPMQ